MFFFSPDIPCAGRGVCALVNRETLLELRSELRSVALSATTIDFFWDSNPQLAARRSSNRSILTTKPRLLPTDPLVIPVQYFH